MGIRGFGPSCWARLLVVLGACAAAAGSAGSNNSKRSQQPTADAVPASRAMAPASATGLWKTSFGPVKIEVDPKAGNPGTVQGVWRYMRGNDEVIGVFWGNLEGNVLRFDWQEPAKPRALEGSGYLAFDVNGARFRGKWWTRSRDRSGDWTGWRADNRAQPNAGEGDGYGYGTDRAGDVGDPAGGDRYGAPAPEEYAPGPPPPPRRR